eukprot:10010891-Alexandrium_andersonii.AAC.1
MPGKTAICHGLVCWKQAELQSTFKVEKRVRTRTASGSIKEPKEPLGIKGCSALARSAGQAAPSSMA